MTAALAAGALLGLSVAAPVGPVSLVCVQRALDAGCLHGVVAGFGAAAVHGLFACVAILSAGAVAASLIEWHGPIRLLSATVLVFLGLRLLLRRRPIAAKVAPAALLATFATTLAMAISNPMTVLPYLAVASSTATAHDAAGALTAWSIPGVMLGAASWYGCLSTTVARCCGAIPAWLLGRINFFTGGAMIVFGLVTTLR